MHAMSPVVVSRVRAVPFDRRRVRCGRVFAVVSTLGLALATACTPGAAGTNPEPAEPEGPVCTEVTALACQDELVGSLLLQAGDVSPQGMVNTDEGEGVFHTAINATAGGLVADPRQSFLYAKFTDEGLSKVEINDDTSLTSADWDIGFHRYILRLNGGSSGPSCVSAAEIAGAFADVAVSDATGANFASDDQFTAACEFRATVEAEDPDNEQDFGVALAPYYDYDGCLAMTDQTFVIQLASRRHVKFSVTHFYEEVAQAECNELGSNIPIGSANLQVRWAFLD